MILHDAELIKEYTQQGLWGETTLDDRFRDNVRRYPQALAIADAPNRAQFAGGMPRRLTYQQLNSVVNAMANVLLQRGVNKDAIVLVQMPNIIEMFVLYLACARIGAVISPIPVQYGSHELGSILDTLGNVRTMVVNNRFMGRDFAAEVRSNLQELQADVPLLIIGETPDLETIFEDNEQLFEDVIQGLPKVSANDIYSICWTSGTVATPKGVPLSHNNWQLYARAVTEAGNIREREHLLNPFPCVNFSGLGISLMAWLHCAGNLFMHHPFDAELFLRQIEEERIGFTVAAPAVLNRILSDEDLLDRFDIGSLHTVMSGSAVLSAEMIDGFKQRFDIDVINGFGANEGITLTSSAEDMPDPARRAEYFPRIGSPEFQPRLNYHHWVKTKLVEPDSGTPITEAGVPGELMVRSGVLFPGYYNRPDLSHKAFDGEGYYRSGDLFEIAEDERGRKIYYRFAGRLKNLVVRGGMKISPEELVALVNRHPKVLESEVIGYPDEILGERVCACVVLKPRETLSKEELVTFMREAGVAKYKWVEVLKQLEQLPRNPVGKVDRKQLLNNILS